MLDLVLCATSTMVAYVVRFEGAIPGSFFVQMLLLVPSLALMRVMANYRMGIYRLVWRYVGLKETLLFVQSIAIPSVILVAIRTLLPDYSPLFVIPGSIVVMEGALTFVGMTGARFVPRIMAEHRQVPAAPASPTITLPRISRGH